MIDGNTIVKILEIFSEPNPKKLSKNSIQLPRNRKKR